MPNGGIDNCGVCGFNRANEGVWGHHHLSDERLANAFCAIRGVKILHALWTYCDNFRTKDLTPSGPICICGLSEAAVLYPRIPWHGSRQPVLNVTGTCTCGRSTENGISIETGAGAEFFCCNAHYVD